MESTNKETVIYNGKKYHRYPDSKRRHLRVYFWRHDKWKEPPVALHRQIYIDTYGEIPKGHHIHHKDENPFNNTIENLECISPSEHNKKHPMSEEARKEAAIRGKRDNKLAKWQKENPEKAKELHRKNGEKSRWEFTKWREKNPEKAKEIYSNAGKKRQQFLKDNPDEQKKIIDNLLKWKEENKDKVIEMSRKNIQAAIKAGRKKKIDNSKYLDKWRSENKELAREIYKKAGQSRKKRVRV